MTQYVSQVPYVQLHIFILFIYLCSVSIYWGVKDWYDDEIPS